MNDDELLRMQQEVEDEVSGAAAEVLPAAVARGAGRIVHGNAENPTSGALWAVIGAAADDDI